MCGSTTNTTTTTPNPQAAANYADVTAQAKNVAATPYQPYNGELVAGMNQGQNDAIGELQAGYGTANPYLNSGTSYLNSASAGLGNVQNYLQTASGLGNLSQVQGLQNQNLNLATGVYNSGLGEAGQVNGALSEQNNYLGSASNAFGAAQGYATPQQFSQSALQQYMSPYTQDVVNSTMANAQQQDAIQAQQLGSNAIGQGAYGGDRSGIAQASLAGQQALANNQTIAGLENQGYSTALGQFNQNQANQFQAASTLGTLGQGYNQTASGAGSVASGLDSLAGVYGNFGQGLAGVASQYGTQGNQQLQDASLYNSLGQTAGQQAQAYGTLAGQAGNLGNIAQSTNTAGASAALQGSTLQQQNAQQQDAAAYQQFQNAIQYPFQTTSYLANIDEGVGSNQGSSTTSPGASVLSQVAGAGTAGLGILGVTGAFGNSGYLTGSSGLLSGLTSDRRAKDDVEPIGKTFDGQTMYRFRYKGDDTVHTGLMAQEVEKHTPQAVGTGLGGLKMVDYGQATDKAAARGHFARGGNVGLGGLGEINRPQVGMSPTQAEARGLVHATGLIGRPPYDTRPIGGSAYARGGLVPGYADGGAADGGDDGSSGMGSVLFDPTGTAGNGGLGLGGLGANAAWSSAGLGVTPTTTQAVRPTGLAPRPASMPVLNAAPIAQPTATGAGLGALAASGGNGSAGFTDPNHDQNVWLGITAAGLGMMGGNSPQAGVNIGQGGLAGLKEYTTLQQQDRTNQLAQSELAIKQQESAMQIAQFQRQLAGAGALAGLNAGGGSSSDTIPGSAAPPAGLGGVAPPMAGGTPAGLGSLTPSTASPPSSVSPPSGADANFWSGVPNESNPSWLANQARIATAYGQENTANQYLTMRDNILKAGTVLRNGQMVPIPGSVETSAAKAGADASATASGKQAGEVQNVFDPDGNPIAVSGSTYQQIIKNGGGVVNGVPVSGTQSAYLKANVENYTDFNKSAMAFEKDYQPNVASLNALSHIYQSYNGGRGAEAIAELDGYAKAAGIENLLPKNWQNSQGGFDAAYKSAVDQSFKQVADSGATKAPATALREALMTTAQPEADSAARYKIITDKLAALNYTHDMIGSVVNSGSQNVLRGMINFQNATKYGDYTAAARAATPPLAGMNPASTSMVLGPTGGSQPGNAVPQPSQPMAQPTGQAPAAQPASSSPSPIAVPPAAQRAAGQVYMTPKGPAKWMGTGWAPVTGTN